MNGTLTYYYKGSDQALANAIHRRLAGSISTVDKGVRKEEFYVIHHTTMPATLIEMAFLSNSSDAALLRSPGFLQRVAVAIADGLADYAASTPLQPTTDGT
jgi:N-acetylmuramoyl-L-alanine amidase